MYHVHDRQCTKFPCLSHNIHPSYCFVLITVLRLRSDHCTKSSRFMLHAIQFRSRRNYKDLEMEKFIQLNDHSSHSEGFKVLVSNDITYFHLFSLDSFILVALRSSWVCNQAYQALSLLIFMLLVLYVNVFRKCC